MRHAFITKAEIRVFGYKIARNVIEDTIGKYTTRNGIYYRKGDNEREKYFFLFIVFIPLTEERR